MNKQQAQEARARLKWNAVLTTGESRKDLRDALDMLTEAMGIVSRVATVGNLIGANDVAEAEALLTKWEEKR